MHGAQNKTLWFILALATVSLAGCAEDADGACATTLPADPGNADHIVHVRMWSEATDDACVELALEDRVALGGLVPSRHPAPGQAPEQPFIPRSYGSLGVGAPSSSVTVSVPAWGVEGHEVLDWEKGENWLLVEVDRDGVQLTLYAEDPYNQAD